MGAQVIPFDSRPAQRSTNAQALPTGRLARYGGFLCAQVAPFCGSIRVAISDSDTADDFEQIADILEIKDNNLFRIRAQRDLVCYRLSE